MAQQVKKFGTFAGVFTPSILTILGVIMYMRLGWVVGQSGLIYALVIVLLAHLISVTTGLSISSIATDKKIKTGGIYYILSRSLGLPIGGSIGITLFIGTALSISLYLIGFSESFLGLEAIRDFTGLEQNTNGFRIMATVAILVLVLIAFISTSVAIKTQFYIMGAILLSLISIVVGFWVHPSVAPEQITMTPFDDEISLEMVFAVFFPAVTGFTAGVAMSGDLKDPRKSIVWGTLLAIGTGFFIYVALTVCFAIFVDRELLLTDYNFLMTIAWFSPLVLAGIWGATLSSALGGILGGPRIMQAISGDRITPRIFAKGYGPNKEPRNALLLIFLIAEGGILIGELDVIAGIVTMFYLVAYGFINLAFFLESWASIDFRPSFKVNKINGLIGFIAAFGIMFQIDMLSMFAALIIMGALFFFLQRKQLRSEYGDVWLSVYSSLVKNVLKRMDTRIIEQRNWHPNILLFSGKLKTRPYLTEFGKNLVGRHGVLSNFELIESPDTKVLFPKAEQSQSSGTSDPRIFIRRKTVKDLYEGVETIAAVYGFSGFEPNTVLMGWGRHTRDPQRFVQMLETLYNLDLNVLLLDYDKKKEFGNYKTIDIWWRDASNQGNLALSLCKHILLSDAWRNATIRLMIVNSLSDQHAPIYQEAKELLDHLRIKANVKVISNHLEQKPFYDIVLAESYMTDLVISGIPEIKPGEEARFVERTNALMPQIGTVLLIRASSLFKSQSLKMGTPRKISSALHIPAALKPSPTFSLPETAPPAIHNTLREIQGVIRNFNGNTIQPFFQQNLQLFKNMEQMILEVLDSCKKAEFTSSGREKQIRQIANLRTNLLVRSEKMVEELKQSILHTQQRDLEAGIHAFQERLGETITQAPKHLDIRRKQTDLKIRNKDPFSLRIRKSMLKLFHSRKSLEAGIVTRFRYHHLLSEELPGPCYRQLTEFLEGLGALQVQQISLVSHLMNATQKYLTMIEQKGIDADKLNHIETEISGTLHQLKELFELRDQEILDKWLEEITHTLITIWEQIDSSMIMESDNRMGTPSMRETGKRLDALPAIWMQNRILLLQGISLELKLTLFSTRLKRILERSVSEIKLLVETRIVTHAESLYSSLEHYARALNKDAGSQFEVPDQKNEFGDRMNFQITIDRIIDKAFIGIRALINKLPEQSEVLSGADLKEPGILMKPDTREVVIPTYELVDFHVQRYLLDTLQQIKGSLTRDLFESLTHMENLLRLVGIHNLQPVKGSGSKEGAGNRKETADPDELIDFVKEQTQNFRQEIDHIQEKILSIREDLTGKLGLTIGELKLDHLLKNPQISRRELGRSDKKRQKGKIRKVFEPVQKQVMKLGALLWYRQSDAWLLARKLSMPEVKQPALVDALQALNEQMSPREGIMERLPFYYRQLFLQKYNFKLEFWFNRSREIEQARKAVSRFKQGYPGALLVRGERHSGKTFFLHYLIKRLYQKHPVYQITPPPAGSSDPETFLSILQEVTAIEGSSDKILSEIDPGALIVIDDLEMWWERSETGNAVIHLINSLIRKHGGKVLFLLAISGDSYRIINHLTDLESSLLSVIELQPFNAIALREALMFRHQTSELGLKIAGKKQPGFFSRTAQARLFARYFTLTKGNIGSALLSWMANITEVADGSLIIRQPVIPDASILDKLPADIRIYITQFMLHKRLDLNTLQRITLDPPEEVEKRILFMLRAGLIRELSGQIFSLNRYLYPIIKDIIH